MSTNERKTYDREFKKQAVQLLINSGRPQTQVARELGVPVWCLRDWRRRLQPQLAQQPETLEALRVRLAQVEREHLQLRQQRHILKNFGCCLDHVSQRYQRIRTLQPNYPLSLLCRVFEVSRAGYHAWRDRKPSVGEQANQRIVEAIEQLHRGPERCYGSPRLTAIREACRERTELNSAPSWRESR